MRRLSLLLVLCLSGCGGDVKSTPGKITEKPRLESELNVTTVGKKAYRSLEIKSEPIRQFVVQEQVPCTGWVCACPGHEVTITAPAAGYITTSRLPPGAGQRVQAGQELFVLHAVLSPVEMIQVATLERSVASELAKAEANVKVAQSEWNRVGDLHKQDVTDKTQP